MKPLAIVTLAVTAALLTGCAASPDTEDQRASKEPAGSPAPDIAKGSPPTTDPGHTQKQAASKDPVEVGKTFVAAAYTWDTRTNTDLTAALKRVDYMATDELAAQFIAQQNTSKGAAWNQAAKNQAHTEPKVTIVTEGNQALTKPKPGAKKVGYMVTWHWAGPSGYQQAGGEELVILTLVETQQGWKIGSFEPTPLKDGESTNGHRAGPHH